MKAWPAAGIAGFPLLPEPAWPSRGAAVRQPLPKRLDMEIVMRIDAVLREEDIVLGMPARAKRPLLAGIAAGLAERAGAREGAVLAALLRRERLGSTGIGQGIAIPHARLPGIAVPAAMLARLEKPVSFDAPDEEPVDLLVALLWPKADGFLPALAGICRLLRSADLRKNLRAAATAAEAHAWLTLPERPLPGRPAARPPRFAPAWNSGMAPVAGT